MKMNNTVKKLACLVLAMLMLLGTVGCKDKESTKKKKKVIKKKVIVVQNNEGTENNDNNNNNVIINTNTGSNETEEEEVEERPERPLPDVAESGSTYIADPIVHEFDHEYKDFTFSKNAVIIYALTKWDDRYEGYSDGEAKKNPISVEYTAENRLAANNIKDWVKKNYNINLEVYRDTVYADKVLNGELTGNEQKILIGESKYFTSSLSQNEFAVKLSGNNLVFDASHFAMVEKAVDWFRTVEVKENKVACLTGKQDNFKSQVTINGVTYDYIWGDEFDGQEFNDDNKWRQSDYGTNRQDDLVNLFNDDRFQGVENGKLRLTADRYYDESSAKIGYATSGKIDTNNSALFRNGYFEFYARIPYRRGAFPAIWTKSADANYQNVPNFSTNDGFGVYSKRCWDIEFDLFETFADKDHMTTTIHKWYTPKTGITTIGDAQDLTEEEYAMVAADQKAVEDGNGQWRYDDPVIKKDKDGNTVYRVDANGETMKDANGEPVPAYVRYPIVFNFDDGAIDTFKYRLSPFTNMSKNLSTYEYAFTYKGDERRQDSKGGLYNWTWDFNPDTINNEYHLYAFNYTSTHCTVYMDGEVYLDFDFDPAYDYKDGKDISRNNNGVGFNLWQYFMINMLIYTPNDTQINFARKVQAGDCPFNLYVDYVRFYQDLSDPSQAVHYVNGLDNY